MSIKWLKVMDDGGGSSLEMCRRLLAVDIMPVVRLYRKQPNPGSISGRELDTIRRLVDVGVRYFETNNEPDLPAEWKNNHLPPNWLDIVIDNFIRDADLVLDAGGLPALPAMGVGSTVNAVGEVVAKGRADLFEHGAWIAIHNYTLNHPLDYPYDRVNQEGVPISEEDYHRLERAHPELNLAGWAWDSQPRELINQWRSEDRNPGATLRDDAACFLAFRLADELARGALGYSVPIISTEGGCVMGWRDDRRYPRIDPWMHAEWAVAINEFMQREAPDYYFAMCHWLIADRRVEPRRPYNWESQCWYSDWWNQEFGLSGQLPVVAAVKAMPSISRLAPHGAASLRGVARTAAARPIVRLSVELHTDRRQIAQERTDTRGEFAFTELAAGTYALGVTGYGIVREGIKLDEGMVRRVTLTLRNGTQGVLAGIVTDTTGQPRSGAELTLLQRTRTVAVTTSGAEGQFRFENLPEGTYRLRANGRGLAGLDVDGWGELQVDMVLPAPVGYRYELTTKRLLPPEETGNRRIFYGRVVDENDEGINGLTMRMTWTGADPGAQFPTTQTGRDPSKPDGYYEFIHTPGEFQIQVVDEEWESDVADGLVTFGIPGREGQPIAYEVNFRRSQVGPTEGESVIEGIIRGSDLAGRAVTLMWDRQSDFVVLAEDGRFAFEQLAEGSYQVGLEGLGVIADDILVDGSSESQAEVAFALLSQVEGTLRGAEPGVPVRLIADRWGLEWEASITARGNFHFTDLPAGHYRLVYNGQELAEFDLDGLQTLRLTPITLVVEERGKITGQVADGRGNGVPGVRLVLRRMGEWLQEQITDADGRFAFADLELGEYEVTPLGMPASPPTLVLTVNAGEEASASFTVPPPVTASLGGRLVDQQGDPVVDQSLILEGPIAAETETAEDGSYLFEGLATGTYRLAAKGVGVLMEEIALQAGEERVLDLTLPETTPDGAISGRVVDASGQPQSALTLILSGPVTVATETDADGQYRFERLPAGGYILSTAASGDLLTITLGEGEEIVQDITLSAPQADKPLARYVLFGRPDTSTSRVRLLLALDYLRHRGVAAGFSVAEAAHAREVTIIGGYQAVTQPEEEALQEAGCQVERIHGSLYELERMLEQMVGENGGG